MQNENTKKIVTMAMLAAMAYALVMLIRIPLVAMPPLRYEPKDVIITIGGFIFGPVEAFLISVVVSVIESFSSETGWIGAVMNIVSTCSFACTAAVIYKKNHTLKGAVIGLIAGTIAMVIVMLLWNYILTPIYMGYPRAAVAAMLPTVFLPFNAIKGGLNAAITMLLYKPIVISLRRARLVPESSSAAGGSLEQDAFGSESEKHKFNIRPGVVLVTLAVLVTFILLALALAGVL